MFGFFDKAVAYFRKEHDGYYIIDEERRMIRMCLQGNGRTYQIVCSVGELDTVNMTIAQLLKIPEDKMEPACVLANLVNRRTIATFTIDKEGDLMVTLSLPGKCFKINKKALCCAYLRAFKEAIICHLAFYQLISAGITPEEAYSYIQFEGNDKSEEFKTPYERLSPL